MPRPAELLRNRIGIAVLACAIAGPPVFACDPLDESDLAALAAASAAPTPTPAPGFTTADFADTLRKHGLEDDADAVAEFPGAVEESTPGFLAGGSIVRVTLDGPIHADVLRFVHQGGRWIRIPRGPSGEKLIANEVRASLHGPEAALAYVRWVLESTAEGAIWPVSSVDDVPLLRARRGEDDRKAELAMVERALGSKIAAPRVDESGGFFVVVQDAVVGRDLVRTTAKVSKLGLATFTHKTLAHDLPVVTAVSFR